MTIYDIASEAGVSISTVSLVLNHPEKVRPVTRKKVERVLEKYHYAPNAMARGLVKNSMKTIGILSNDFRHLHFSSTAYILESMFFNWGFSTILCNTGYDLEKKKKYIKTFAEKKVDAVVLIGSVFNHPEIERMILTYLPETPVVLANGVLSVPNAYSVLIDQITGLELAVGHLAEKGHREILFVYQRPSYNALEKINGYRMAMEKRGFEVRDDNIWRAGPGFEMGCDVTDRILKSGKPFTAIICADDLTALGVIKELKQRGRRVPQDVAVIGYDNSTFSSCFDPGVTSVDTRNDVFSNIVANVVYDLLSKREVGSHIIVKPELAIREST